jgi:GNAT superfamily N-acetyltransferase
MKHAISGQFALRVAGVDDAAVMTDLLAQMDVEVPAPINDVDLTRMTGVLEDMQAYPDFKAYLLLERGLPVATFSLMIFASPSHHGIRQAVLDAVVVAHAQRGRGCGEVIVRHAMRLAQAAGCYKLVLSSNLKREPAHRLYEKLGFEQHGLSFSITFEARTQDQTLLRKKDSQ